MKAVMKAEIMEFIVKKAEVRNPSHHYELVDLHTNFDYNRQYQTNIGGFL